LAEFLPVEEKYGLRSQICRSAVSIPSNIAEGCSRSSQIDFKRFLEIALGSSFELETQLIIIEELSVISDGDIRVVLDQLHKEQKMINNLISKIKANS
jgi:four helix bundle protein